MRRTRTPSWIALTLALALAGATASARAASVASSPGRPHAAHPERSHAETGGCTRLPAGKRVVKLNLKPETEVADLIGWISAITCRQFILSGELPASHAKVTIIAPALITPAEAYRLFLDALDSVGLAVYSSGPFMRVVESAKAKTSPVPVIGFGDSDR